MNAGTKKVQFVCVRPAHHRRWAAAELCEHAGLGAYCPAGAVGEHDWMPASTDLATLTHVGFHRTREGVAADERAADEGDMLTLMRP